MTKLPISLLLYVGILGLAGGSGYQFYLAVTGDDRPVDPNENKSQFDKAIDRGKAISGESKTGPRWDLPEFWVKFRDANFTGKEPPPPPTPIEDQQPVEPEPVAQTPLEDIFALVCAVHDGPRSRIVIRYKPTANVEPPADYVGTASPLRDVVAPAAGNRRGAPAAPSFPMPDQSLIQELVLEETLWKPFAHIRFVRVAEDASHAVFVREDPAIAKDQWKEEELYPEVLNLPQSVLKALGDAPRAKPVAGREAAAEPQEASSWIPADETTEVAANRFNIGRRDRDQIESDPGRIFNNDVGTASFVSQSGKIRGVKITSVAKGYERYGVAAGDIVLSINGEAVESKSDAIKVGKRQYRRGVRTFEVEFLIRGRRVVRSYVAPDE